jgi:hypothetical protein
MFGSHFSSIPVYSSPLLSLTVTFVFTARPSIFSGVIFKQAYLTFTFMVAIT